MTESSAPPNWRPKIAMIAFPDLTMLDLVGPWETLRLHCDLHLLGTSEENFFSDTGLPFRTTRLIADADDHYDVVFVPGGDGSVVAMRNPEIIGFLADRGPRARYVTSVCTGALVLGAAGLLDGYRATTHWTCMESLPLFGAIPTEGRVVIDRNRITGGGVTAGVDFGLTLLATLLDEEAARFSQLVIEYNPAPPFDGGSPHGADPQTVAKVKESVNALNISCQQWAAEQLQGAE